EAMANLWSSPKASRLPLCESSTCTPMRPPTFFWIDFRLAAPAGAAQAAARVMPNNARRDNISVLGQHDDHVVLGEAVFLGLLRVHVDTIAAIPVVGMFHQPVADGGLAALRRGLEHRVEIHVAA